MQTQTLTRARMAKPARPIQSRPKRRPPAGAERLLPQHGGTTCPVERLATEAAATLRAIYALGDHEAIDCPAGVKRPAMVKALSKRERGPDLADVRQVLSDRLRSCVKAASYELAISVKGALFQMLLIVEETSWIEGHLINAQALRIEDYRELKSMQRRVALRGHSALNALEALHPDEDLRLLRSWFFKAEDDPLAAADWAMTEAARSASA